MQFSNYGEHPTHPNYIIYSFKTKAEAEHFENQLTGASIWFEKDDSGEEEFPELTRYAVKKFNQKQANQFNFLTSAEYRKPFLANVQFRYLVVGLTLLMIILAIIGYIVTDGNSTAEGIQTQLPG